MTYFSYISELKIAENIKYSPISLQMFVFFFNWTFSHRAT